MNTFAYVWDIMPTILDLTGIEHPKESQGLQVERMRGKFLKTEKGHLYNLANDPGETRDLAREQPEKLKKLHAAWHRYAMDVGVVLSK